MITAVIATSFGLSLSVLKSTKWHYFLYSLGIFSFTQALAALGPFIPPTLLAGCVIGLGPQHGNKLALPK